MHAFQKEQLAGEMRMEREKMRKMVREKTRAVAEAEEEKQAMSKELLTCQRDADRRVAAAEEEAAVANLSADRCDAHVRRRQ